jgi:DNA-binding transcriptional ArsR family regulator
MGDNAVGYGEAASRHGETGSFRLDYQDLLNVRLARRPAPLVDLWLAVASARAPCAGPLFAARQRRLRGRLTRAALPLFDLVEATGDGPDFLAPVSDGLDEGLDAILATPAEVVASQLAEAFGDRRPPRWVRALADGDRRARATLVDALSQTHRGVVGTDRGALRDGFDRDLAWRGELLFSEGLHAVLDSIPNIRWTGRTFESEHHVPPSWQLPLAGRGLTLLPSAAWIGLPGLCPAPDGSWLLMYAALDPVTLASGATAPDALAALLGHTRAAVLRLLVRPHSTTGIARQLGISPASASQHARILRSAGLVTSRRDNAAVFHRCTPPGRHLASR